MIARIARFELRHQFARPVVWFAALALFVAAFALSADETIRLDPSGSLKKNAPLALAQLAAFFSVAYVFALAPMIAEAVLRDDESGFGAIIWSTPVRKHEYLLGRFAGTLSASAVVFLAMPLGVLAGTSMPWLDPALLGPHRTTPYVLALTAFALPNIIVAATVLFASAVATRSALATHLAGVAVLTLYVIAGVALPSGHEFSTVRALVDPFGIAALQDQTRYWTPLEQNTLRVKFAGLLAANRLLWLALAMLVLITAVRRYRWGAPDAGGRARRPERPEASVPAPYVGPLPRTDASRAAATQLIATARFELAAVFRGRVIYALLGIGLVQWFAALWNIRTTYGTPTYPVTRQMIELLELSFTTIPMLVAVIYAGEAVWRDRRNRVAELLDASPVPNWVPVLAKIAAVTTVLLATLLLSVAAAALVQLLKHFPDFEPNKYLAWYVVPRAVDLALTAVLAIAVQVVSPNRFVGYALMLLYVGWTLAAPALGLEHHLWRYGAVPYVPLSDMNDPADFAATAWCYRLFWLACAAMLAVTAHLLWPRGTSTALRPRLRRARMSTRVAAGVALALLIAAASGGWIVYNTMVLNPHRGTLAQERDAADLERRYLRFERLPQPTITDLRLDVAIQPASKRVDASGSLQLTNLTGQPVTELHLLMADRDTEVRALMVAGAELRLLDRRHGYRIYRLDRPMLPRETRVVRFSTRRWQRGFRDSAPDTAVVRNGTFLTSFMLAPFVGINRAALLQDRSARRRQGLPLELGLPPLADALAADRVRGGVAWARSDVTVSTTADQTPIAPGRRVSDVVRDGRRTARFVSEAPTLPVLSIQSGDYAVRRVRDGGVDVEVYYHPAHFWNVDRMLRAMRGSLAYYRESFGPYPRGHARIVEFPNFEQTARAFAGTIPYSEGVGFVADNRDPDVLDHVAIVTAHELAHQYWGHQVLGADVEGETLLSESMAEYSALIVLKRMYGADALRRYVTFERDRYFAGRAADPAGEVPLIRVGNQPHLHYGKGALALYQVQELIGEAAMNRAIRSYLARFRFRGPPYPRSIDLVAELKRVAPDRSTREFIADLFERVTLFDLKTGGAVAKRRADGRWDVGVTIDAAKRYADAEGRERAAEFEQGVEIGFARRDPTSGLRRSDLIAVIKAKVRSGRQTFRFVLDHRPAFAVTDPNLLFLDRDVQDNVRAVR